VGRSVRVVVIPVIGPPAAMTIAPFSTLTSPAWKKSVFFQPSSDLPSNRTIVDAALSSPRAAGTSASAQSAARKFSRQTLGLVRAVVMFGRVSGKRLPE
jgi:hypothetical protein